MTDKDLLAKGLLIAFIGAVVLLSPYFVQPSAIRDVISQSSLVGWFALILGAAFIVRWALVRRKK
ncbi:MAG: hypothetical protein JWQ07_3821 [Ramlibacter sp.]|nr:hypothetical protein [Ramlibacter sp.]